MGENCEGRNIHLTENFKSPKFKPSNSTIANINKVYNLGFIETGLKHLALTKVSNKLSRMLNWA